MTKKRLIRQTQEFAECTDIDAFLGEIEAVCRKHKLSIAHEDIHGAFIVQGFDERWNIALAQADDGR